MVSCGEELSFPESMLTEQDMKEQQLEEQQLEAAGSVRPWIRIPVHRWD